MMTNKLLHIITRGSHSNIIMATVVFLLCVFVLNLFWLVLPSQYHINESSDYQNYYEPVARNILNGSGIVLAGEDVFTFYPPGFSIILASLFRVSDILNIPERKLFYIFTALCLGAASVLIFLLARSLWSPLGAFIVALTWMTYLPILWFSKQPNSSIPFMAFFYAGLYLFWRAIFYKEIRWYRWFLIGVVIGISMLIRPIAIGVGLVMVCILLSVPSQIKRQSKILLASVLLLGNLLTVMPWCAYASLKSGNVVLLSSCGTDAALDGLTFDAKSKPRKVPQDVIVLMDDICANFGKLQSAGSVTTFLARELIQRPITVLKLFCIKAMRVWYATDSMRYERIIILFQLPYVLLILCGSVYAWKRKGISRQLIVGTWIVVFYFWLIAITALSILRYMVPAIGLLFVFIPGILPGRLKDRNS